MPLTIHDETIDDRRTMFRILALCIIGLAATVLVVRAVSRPSSSDVAGAAPTRVNVEQQADRQPTMSDVLEMAQAAHQHMSQNLHDYTSRFIKQETVSGGKLTEESEMLLKVQTQFAADGSRAPRRVYMKFERPESVKGREVIWGEDLYEGKMAVHEVGLILGLKTHWLDPTGMLAMAGQRYPISEIGMVRLVEKLIRRGETDRDNPNIEVTVSPDQTFPDIETELIQVRRTQPVGDIDDFSLAEIVIDRQRQLILSYRSFGWPEIEGDTPPLIESYIYRDVQTNVGLTDADFDYQNPEYGYPAL